MVTSSKLQPLAGFQGVTSFSLSPNKQEIAFVQKDDIWVESLIDKVIRRLTHMPDGMHVPNFLYRLMPNMLNSMQPAMSRCQSRSLITETS
jgi:hypothetical protein